MLATKIELEKKAKEAAELARRYELEREAKEEANLINSLKQEQKEKAETDLKRLEAMQKRTKSLEDKLTLKDAIREAKKVVELTKMANPNYESQNNFNMLGIRSRWNASNRAMSNGIKPSSCNFNKIKRIAGRKCIEIY